MATLLYRVCKLCKSETYLEDGYVQCDCIKVYEEDWATGILETPKEWDSDIEAILYYRQERYEGMIDNLAGTNVDLRTQNTLLKQDNIELSALVFDLRSENYALRERVENLEKMITRSA